MKIDYQTRVKAGALALLALTALLTNLAYLRDNVRTVPQTAGRDEVAEYERRFAELKEALPRRGVVGYVSDEADASEEAKKYYLTQYALAPLVVVRGADRPLVVGNFAAGGTPAPAAGLALVKDYGDGVVLFGREAR